MKKTIISNLELQFVEQFPKWKEKLDLFNETVDGYNRSFDKKLRPMTYDHFCKLFIKGSKALLDQHVKMCDIVPTQEELDRMRGGENGDGANDFKKNYTILLEAKYAIVKQVLAREWDGHVFKYIVSRKYGSQHFEGMLMAKRKID